MGETLRPFEQAGDLQCHVIYHWANPPGRVSDEVLQAFIVSPRFDWPDDAFFYPTTDFEQDWLHLGRSIHRARWLKIAR